MDYSPILVPVVALVAWTLIVMLWMLVTRMAAFAPHGHHCGDDPGRLARRRPGRQGRRRARSGNRTITTI